MTSSIGRKSTFVSDFFTSTDVFYKNRRSILISGVGSGKNYFFEHCFSNILLVTSRKAKVQERKDAGVSYISHSSFGKIIQNNVDEIRENYSLVMIDEAHTLVTDSLFADDNAYIYDFLEHCIDTPVVLVTGTPQPILPYCEKRNYNIIDLREKCRNIIPNEILLAKKADIPTIIGNYDNLGYYGLTKKSLLRTQDTIVSLKGEAASLHTAATKRYSGFVNTNAVVNTSALREGIEIFWDEPANVICESHDMLEAYQYAGRFRNGVDKLFIITDEKNKKINTAPLSTAELARNTLKYNSGLHLLSDKLLETELKGLLKRSVVDDSVAFFYEWKIDAIKYVNNAINRFNKDATKEVRSYFGNKCVVRRYSPAERTKHEVPERYVYNKTKKLIEDTLAEHGNNKVYDENGKVVRCELNDQVAKEIIESSANGGYVNSRCLVVRQPKRFFKHFGYEANRKSQNSERANYHTFIVSKI